MGFFTKFSFSIKNFFFNSCRLFGQHDFVILERFNSDILKVQCSKCKKVYAADLAKGKMVLWDDEVSFLMKMIKSQDGAHKNREVVENHENEQVELIEISSQLYETSLGY